MVVRIGCIVEGHGETRAVPTIIQRVAREIDPTMVVHVAAVLRVPRDKLVKGDELDRAVESAARKLGRPSGILIVFDSDDDCPAQLGPALLQRALRTRGDLSIGVVLATREFESWYLAAAESLRGQQGLSLDLRPPRNPEAVRGAKEWLSRRMPREQPYSATVDQPALAASFDLNLARRAPSFDKCYREIERLLTSLQQTER